LNKKLTEKTLLDLFGLQRNISRVAKQQKTLFSTASLSCAFRSLFASPPRAEQTVKFHL